MPLSSPPTITAVQREFDVMCLHLEQAHGLQQPSGHLSSKGTTYEILTRVLMLSTTKKKRAV